MSYFVAGGFPMFFLVVFGAVALIGAARFALHPAPGRLAPVAAYALAVAWMSLAGAAFDLMSVGRYISGETFEEPTSLIQIALVGIAESMAPIVLGGAILAVIALVAAVGLRRMPPA